MEVWRRAADATRDVLTREDRDAIEAEVAAFLDTHGLDLEVNEAGVVSGCMVLHRGLLEALFLHPDICGCGVGRARVKEALRRYPQLSTDVNEQTPQAAGCYGPLDFARIGRSPLDGTMRPYPLIDPRYANIAAQARRSALEGQGARRHLPRIDGEPPPAQSRLWAAVARPWTLGWHSAQRSQRF